MWLTHAKRRWLASVPEQEKEALKAKLERVGYHAEIRSGVRAPEFRGLPPKIQEQIAGKSFKMIKSTYDEVTVADIRDHGEVIGIPKTG